MKIGIIIQARTGSTRLPGKVIEPFVGRQSILEIIIERILKQFDADQVILATTVSGSDDPIEKVGNDFGIHVFRGSEDNVLSRFTGVIRQFNLDGVVRVCADNPFLDVDSFHDLIKWGVENKADYSAFSISDTVPTIKSHFGLWAEYVSADALLRAEKLTTEKLYQEHVTNFIYGNSDKFAVDLHVLPHNWALEKNIRFTLDTEEDFKLLEKMYQDCILHTIKFSPASLISYVKAHPEIENEMAIQVQRWEK
tara:strand:- start:125168 stop:125923 length:756 start_codon:yes stop_codon:yes gene_type:complete